MEVRESYCKLQLLGEIDVSQRKLTIQMEVDGLLRRFIRIEV